MLRRNLILLGSIMAIALGLLSLLPYLPIDGPLMPLLFAWACISPVIFWLRMEHLSARRVGNEHLIKVTHQRFVVALVAVGGFSVWALFQ